MTGFEPRTSGIGSDRSTNWATTIAQALHTLINLSNWWLYKPVNFVYIYNLTSHWKCKLRRIAQVFINKRATLVRVFVNREMNSIEARMLKGISCPESLREFFRSEKVSGSKGKTCRKEKNIKNWLCVSLNAFFGSSRRYSYHR